MVVSLLSVGKRRDSNLNRKGGHARAQRGHKNFVLCAFAVNFLLNRTTNTLRRHYQKDWPEASGRGRYTPNIGKYSITASATYSNTTAKLLVITCIVIGTQIDLLHS